MGKPCYTLMSIESYAIRLCGWANGENLGNWEMIVEKRCTPGTVPPPGCRIFHFEGVFQWEFSLPWGMGHIL